MNQVNYTVLNREALPRDGSTFEFQGFHHLDKTVSFIWVDMPPGGKVRLHKHPYQEIFIMLEGVAVFTVGPAALEVRAEQVIIVPSEVPHKFMNAGDRQWKQLDIRDSDRFITDWLEEQV